MEVQRLISPALSLSPKKAEARSSSGEQAPVPGEGHGYLGVFVPNTSLAETSIAGRLLNSEVPAQYDPLLKNMCFRLMSAVRPSWRFADALRDYQDRTGKKAAVVMGFQPFFNEGSWEWQEFPEAFCNAVYNNVCNAGTLERSVPMITWEPWTFEGRDHSKYLLDEIIDAVNTKKGSLYEYMSRWAKAAKKYGKPIMLRPMHEMNCDTYPWRGLANGGDMDEVSLVKKGSDGSYSALVDPSRNKGNGISDGPERYIAAWLKIRELFKKEGAENVSFVWCANNDSRPSPTEKGTKDDRSTSPWKWNSMGSYYPGDENVDWVGFDGYQTDATNKTCDDVFAPFEQFLEQYKPNRPLAICEIGSRPSNLRDAFFARAFEKAKANRFKLVMLFNVDKEQDWDIFSPVWGLSDKNNTLYNRHFAALAAYRAGTSDGYFLGASGEPSVTSYVSNSPSILPSGTSYAGYTESLPPETGRLVREQEWNEKRKMAYIDFQKFVANIGKRLQLMKNAPLDQKYMMICSAVEAYEKMITQYSEVYAEDIGVNSENGIDVAKQDLFKALLGLLSSIPKDNNAYLLALVKVKSLLFSWNKEWDLDDKNIPKEVVRIDYNTNAMKELLPFALVKTGKKDASGKDIYDYRPIMVGTQPLPSPVYGVCETIIELALNDEYCKKNEVNFDEAARWGLIASALSTEAALLLQYYYQYYPLDPKETEILMKDVRKLIARSWMYSVKKVAALGWKGSSPKALAKKLLNDEWALTAAKKREASDFHLRCELDFMMAQCEVENSKPTSDGKAKALSTYSRLLNDQYVSSDLKGRVKRAYIRLLLLQGGKEANSKALALLNETVNMDEKNRKKTDEGRTKLQERWASNVFKPEALDIHP